MSEQAAACCKPATTYFKLADTYSVEATLREKCPNTEIFLALILPHTLYLSVFSPNAEKYGPEKTPYLDTFHAVLLYDF